ncbi:hypothetical protein [Xanthomonas albilineans]|uniref:hypothetical protein n=1 Tax=Xanthomonas albilineans TaxID=29447 RepID=UPI0005F35D55|nr:hypothetical protein [Xanthomonas albilineans]
MGFPNTKGSEQLAIVSSTGPVNANAAQTDWIAISNVHRLLALIVVGTNVGGVLNAQLLQALDATGTNAKPITAANGQAKALTPITIGNAANLQALIDCSVDELDTNNGYAFVQLQITLSSAGPIAGLLMGINPRFEPASALNATSVLQITG